MVNKALKQSFANVKQDIMALQKNDQLIDNFAKQTVTKIKELEDKMDFLAKLLRAFDKAGVMDGTSVVASKTARKAHAPNCADGKKIHAENKQFFNSIEEATSKGYEACECAIA